MHLRGRSFPSGVFDKVLSLPQEGSTRERVLCPHCHSTFSNSGNLQRHLRICKQKKDQLELLQTDVVPCQTARQQGKPANPLSTHSVSSSSGHGNPSGSSLWEMDEPDRSDCIHSPMVAPTQDIPSLIKQPKLHFPSSGSKEGKAKWAEIDRQMKRELPHVFPGGLSLCNLDLVVDRLHKFVRSFFPPPPVINPREGSRRQRHIIPQGMRRRQRELRREWRQRHSTPGINEEALRMEYNALRREMRRRVRLGLLQSDLVKHANNVQAFRRDPYKFSKRLFETQQQLEPEFGKEVADSHFSSVYSDGDRGHVFEDINDLPPAPMPTCLFNDAPPTIQEIMNVIRKSRNGSAPGPSGIPYVVYKNLPSLVAVLRRLFEKVWKSKEIPLPWRVASMILLAKSDDTSHPSAMRNIALGNSEGKLFFAVVAHRIQKHMSNNKYFDGIAQKGFMPGVSGCIEHSAVLREALGDARRRSKSICITWVDFANAFGSVKHSLIQYALRRYHFPEGFRRLIFGYYDQLYAMVHCKDFSSAPFHYGIGVFQGCTTSPVLFNIVIQILLDILQSPDNQHLAYEFQPASDGSARKVMAPTFADDIAFLTKSADGCQHLLTLTEKFCTWSMSMRLKPPKCFAVAYKIFSGSTSRFAPRGSKKWSAYDPVLVVNNHRLQMLGDEGFKYLGKIIEVDLGERCLKVQIEDKLTAWMRVVDSCLIDDAMKCWIYNFVIISKLAWWFTVSELSVSYAKRLHGLVMPFLKKWCRIPQRGGNTAILFCGSQSFLGLSLKRTYTVYKAMQVVRRGILKKSKDPVVRHVFYLEHLRQSRWSGPRFAAALQVAAVEAQASDVVVTGQHRGLGFRQTNYENMKVTASSFFTEQDSKDQLEHASSLVTQGKLHSFDCDLKRDWKWEYLLSGCTSSMFHFKINSTNNTLPTGANLSRWSNGQVQVSCGGCRAPRPTLKHILNGCYTFLSQGRYTWRHNSVLKVIYRGIKGKCDEIRRNEHVAQVALPFISFVREGQSRAGRLHEPPQSLRRPLCTGVLQEAFDWCILSDGITSGYQFPHEIAVTTLRPDIVLYSVSKRVCVLIELTVPMEDRLIQSSISKTERYSRLCREIHSNNWTCSLYTVEVGSRGNDSTSLGRCLTALGFSRAERRNTQRESAATAQRCSYYIYLKRNDPVWTIAT